MAVGDMLHRIARKGCSPDLCRRVLEPAIADLQHHDAHAGRRASRIRTLLGGYAAFWQSFGWCLARDAVAPESREHLGRTAVAFAIVVSAMAASEALLLHSEVSMLVVDDNTGLNIREAALRILSMGIYVRYVGWSARLDSATLMFGVPLAMFPVLLYSTRRRATFAPGAALFAIALGTLMTIVSSGWIAPAVARWDASRQRDRFIAAGGRSFVLPIDSFDGCPDCKAWPDLIRGAFAPLEHRYPGYPNYVAPEDRGLPEWYRSVARERLLLVLLAMSAGLSGWWLGQVSSTSAPKLCQADDDRV